MNNDIVRLAAAADWLWSTCELDNHEDLDPDDHVAIIKRAYSSSDCDDFSYALHTMTGWPVLQATWIHKDYGVGHHSLVISPDGRLLDVNGWTTEYEVARRYRPRSPNKVVFKQVKPVPMMEDDDHNEKGISDTATLRTWVIRCLPYEPFDQADFQVMSMIPVEGVDFSERDSNTRSLKVSS